MKKLALLAALAAVAIALPLSLGSSHREAPNTALDPTGDDTDVYAFTAKNDPSTTRNEEDRLTVVANWIPFEDPAGGPNFYRFDDRAHYYINIDNSGDGKADIRYEYEFTTKVRDKNSFLYAKPTVDSIDDADLNIVQTYDITRERRHGRDQKIADDLPVAPNNVGPKTMPNYDLLAQQAIRETRGGNSVFVGQRDDPFFVDLGATFDALNIRQLTGDKGGGKDDLAGYAVHSIVMQIQEEELTRDGEEVTGPNDPHAVVGVWASTERRKLQVTDADAIGGRRNGDDDDDDDDDDNGRGGQGNFTQVSRLGNPLVNEVVIPLGKKDQFNRTKPDADAQYGSFVVEPELAKLLNALFGLGVKETGRTDIVNALLIGFEGLNKHGSRPVDTLKINLGTPPTDSPGRFGALPNAATGFPAGDPAGFPNGRRLTDDVVDIELRVVAGALLDPSDPKRNLTPLGDGVDENDKDFSSTFPYVAAPDSGFDSKIPKAIEPTHPSQ